MAIIIAPKLSIIQSDDESNNQLLATLSWQEPYFIKLIVFKKIILKNSVWFLWKMCQNNEFRDAEDGAKDSFNHLYW